MADEARTCPECQGSMSPIIIMDKQPGVTRYSAAGALEYRLPDDRISFWTGKYPTAGSVRAFMCGGCGRITLYGAETQQT
jgi:hypothetical protein